MEHFLLDTNICIYIIKQKPVAVFDKFRALPLGSVGISTITLSELTYGIEKSSKPKQNQEALHQFLLPLEIYDFGVAAAIQYGEIRAYLESKGTPIGPLDMQIAAHARALGHTLVTNNVKEFNRVEGLLIENWVR